MLPQRRYVHSKNDVENFTDFLSDPNENGDYMRKCLDSVNISWSFEKLLDDPLGLASHEIILIHAFHPPVDEHGFTLCDQGGMCHCCAARQALESWAEQGVQFQYTSLRLSVLSFSIKQTLLMGADVLVPMVWKLGQILRELSMEQNSPLSFLGRIDCVHQRHEPKPHKVLLMAHGLGNTVLKRTLTNLREEGCHLDPAGVFLFDDFDDTSETSAENYLINMGSFFQLDHDMGNTDAIIKKLLKAFMVDVEKDYRAMIEELYPTASGHLSLGIEHPHDHEIDLVDEETYRYMYIHYKADFWQYHDCYLYGEHRKESQRPSFGEPEEPASHLDNLQRFKLEVSIREAISEVLFKRREKDSDTQMRPGSPTSASAIDPYHLNVMDQHDTHMEESSTATADWATEIERQHAEGQYQGMEIDQHAGIGHTDSSDNTDQLHTLTVPSNSIASVMLPEDQILPVSLPWQSSGQPHRINRDTYDSLRIDNYLNRGGFQTHVLFPDRDYSPDESSGDDKIGVDEPHGDSRPEARSSPTIVNIESLAGPPEVTECGPPSISTGESVVGEEEEPLLWNHEQNAGPLPTSMNVQESHEDLISEALLELEHGQTHVEESPLDVLVGQIGKAIAIATPNADMRYPGIRPALQSLMVHLQNAQNESRQESQREAQRRPWEVHEDENDLPAPTPLLHYTLLFNQNGALRDPLPDDILHSLELEYYGRQGIRFPLVSVEDRDKIHKELTQRVILEVLGAKDISESTNEHAGTLRDREVEVNLNDIDDHQAEALVETEDGRRNEFLQPPTENVDFRGSEESIPELSYYTGNSDLPDMTQQEVDYDDLYLSGKQERGISPISQLEATLQAPGRDENDAYVGDGGGHDTEGYALEETMQKMDGEEEEVDGDDNFF